LEALSVLASSDAARLLRFVAEAERIGGDQPFTGEFLVELGSLIEADWVTYTEVDHVRRRSLMYMPRPGDEDDESEDLDDHDWALMNEHPVCRRWRKEGRSSALRMSDVITQRDLRQNRFYTQYLRPWGIEYELKVRLPSSPPWLAQTFMFNRKLGRDFTKRDRLVLELLTPHFTRLWQTARVRRLLASTLEALEWAPETDSRGIVLLSRRREVDFASGPARRLLRAFFPPATGGQLPTPLVDWLESETAEPFVFPTETGRLIVRRTGEALLLEEEQQRDVELTAREREVLGWVARGKTNPQIAELLWLAPSTVRKHLENVYAKLGVSTRTAAVTRFLGLIDAEAS
jgi:DNA-binding CsgD family transcriptional regulator